MLHFCQIVLFITDSINRRCLGYTLSPAVHSLIFQVFHITRVILFGKSENPRSRSILLNMFFKHLEKASLLTVSQVAAMLSSLLTLTLHPFISTEKGPTGNKAREIKIRFEPDAWSWSCQW